MNINLVICELVEYAVEHSLIDNSDRAYSVARLLEILHHSDFTPCEVKEIRPLEKILADALDYAFENKLIKDNGITYRDLFDTKIMGIVTPRPSEVIHNFTSLYSISPKAADMSPISSLAWCS